MGNTPEILINGKPLTHKIGDRPFVIEFGIDGFTPCVKQCACGIDKITITAEGVLYQGNDNFIFDGTTRPTDKCEYAFWSEKEAKEWLESNLPEKHSFNSENREFFRVYDGILEKDTVRTMTIQNGKIGYLPSKAYKFFTEEDIGKNVFFTYEEAKEVRDVIEALNYK